MAKKQKIELEISSQSAEHAAEALAKGFERGRNELGKFMSSADMFNAALARSAQEIRTIENAVDRLALKFQALRTSLPGNVFVPGSAAIAAPFAPQIAGTTQFNPLLGQAAATSVAMSASTPRYAPTTFVPPGAYSPQTSVTQTATRYAANAGEYSIEQLPYYIQSSRRIGAAANAAAITSNGSNLPALATSPYYQGPGTGWQFYNAGQMTLHSNPWVVDGEFVSGQSYNFYDAPQAKAARAAAVKAAKVVDPNKQFWGDIRDEVTGARIMGGGGGIGNGNRVNVDLGGSGGGSAAAIEAQAAKSLVTPGKLIGGYLAYREVKDAISTLREFEKGTTDVAKSADLSAAEVKALGDAVVQMSLDMPVSTSELLSIGDAAGQLGIKGTKNIVDFTRTITEMGVATNLHGYQAAEVMAKLLNATGEPVESAHRLGSAIVQLGNDFVGTESDIAHIGQYVAQATSQFRVSSVDSVAFGAALASIGVRAELGATSLGKLFQALDEGSRGNKEKMNLFTMMTGQSADQVKEGFLKDPTEQIAKFLKGLGEFEKKGGDVSKVLEILEVGGSRNLRVIPTLANNYELLARAIDTSRSAYEKDIALKKEFDRYNQTLDSNMKKFGNTYDAIILKLRNSTGVMSEVVAFARHTVQAIFGLGEQGYKATDGVTIAAGAVKILTGAVGVLLALKVGSWGLEWFTAFMNVGKQAGFMATAFTAVTRAVAAFAVAILAYDFGKTLMQNFKGVNQVMAQTIYYAEEGANKITTAFARMQQSSQGWFNKVPQSVLQGNIYDDAFRKASFAIGHDRAGTPLSDTLHELAINKNKADNGEATSLDTILTLLRQTVQTQNDQYVTPDDLHKAQAIAQDLLLALNKEKAIPGDWVSKNKVELESLISSASAKLAWEMSLTNINQQFDDKPSPTIKSFMTDFYHNLAETVKALDQFGLGDTGIINIETIIGKPADWAAGPKALREESKLAENELEILAKKQEAAIDRIQEKFAAIQAQSRDFAFGRDSIEKGVYEFDKNLREQFNTIGLTAPKDSSQQQIVDVKAVLTNNKMNDTQKWNYLHDAYVQQERFNKELAKTRELADGVGDSLGNAFQDYIMGAKSAGEATAGLLKEISALVIKQTIAQPIANFASNLLFKFMSPSAPIPAPIPHAAGDVFTSPFMFSYGGKTHSAVENGPEAIMPLARGPDGKLGVSGSSGHTTNNYNIYAKDADTFRRGSRQILAELKKV